MHDLETIHFAVTRWCLATGIAMSHPKALRAAREAFRLYRQDMDEQELAVLLHHSMRAIH